MMVPTHPRRWPTWRPMAGIGRNDCTAPPTGAILRASHIARSTVLSEAMRRVTAGADVRVRDLRVDDSDGPSSPS